MRAGSIGHAAPHLAAGPAHPSSKAVITPRGTFGSATLAAQAYGFTRQRAGQLARAGRDGWRYVDQDRKTWSSVPPFRA
jgi:hypothetical protein